MPALDGKVILITGASRGVGRTTALLLARHGDRGVAAGIAISVGVAWSAVACALAVRWAMTGDWPLW